MSYAVSLGQISTTTIKKSKTVCDGLKVWFQKIQKFEKIPREEIKKKYVSTISHTLSLSPHVFENKQNQTQIRVGVPLERHILWSVQGYEAIY